VWGKIKNIKQEAKGRIITLDAKTTIDKYKSVTKTV
jgi:hypothetical protein